MTQVLGFTSPYYLNGNADVNDEIEPKHPAFGLASRKWTRVCFMNALTEPLFAELPLTFRSARFVRDKFNGKIHGEVEFTINCGAGAAGVPVVLILDSSASLPLDWETTFTQETLRRPYRESMDFWGSVASFKVANLGAHQTSDGFYYLFVKCAGLYKNAHPAFVATLDLLLTIFVEVNWVATTNMPWCLAFCFPYFWVAHAIKFEVVWNYARGARGAHISYRPAIRVLVQDPMFFETAKRLLRDFELNALPVRSVELLYDEPSKDDLATQFFHGIFGNVVDVKTDVHPETWDCIEAMIRTNFPNLCRLVSYRIQHPHAKFRLARFLLNHGDNVKFETIPDKSFEVLEYVTNARAMRVFIEAASPTMLAFVETAAPNTPLPIFRGLFFSRLFEPHVLHIIDRFLHGCDVLHITPARNQLRGVEEGDFSTAAARMSMRDL